MKINRRTSQAEVPAMAMGDIAFNLLIFFVILARARDDSHLQWTPAEAKKIETAGHSRVSIVIDKENDLFLNGHQIGVSQLEPRVDELLSNVPPGERTVLLKIHQGTLAQRFEPVIEAVSKSGGELVHIVEEKK